MSPTEKDLQNAVEFERISTKLESLIEKMDGMQEDISDLYKRTEATKMQLAKWSGSAFVIGCLVPYLLNLMFKGS